MDFFARQERSRRATVVLVVLFALAFLAVVAATTLLAAFVLRLYTQGSTWLAAGETFGDWLLRYGNVLALVACGTLAALAIASLYRAALLARGGGQVALLLGGTEVTGDSADPLHRRLLNVVEEMAIAAGLPVPEVYVLEREPGINAFAAGLSPSDAAIAVTRGALERLNRAELQGVVAHEFGHVLNGDMRLNQQLIGLSYGILVLSLAGRWLLRSARVGRRGRTSRGNSAAALLGVGLVVIGGIGVLLSRLIKAAVSRERERLADACAVQFTREPSGLAGALKKIAGYTSTLSSVDAEEVAHMLFGRGARAFSGLFATHPPIEERIRALDPRFDPRELARAAEPLPGLAGAAAAWPAAHEMQHAVAHAAGESVPAPPRTMPAERILDRAGAIDGAAVGEALRAALPEEIYHAAHSRESSLLLVLALALADGGDARRRQLALLESQLGVERAARVRSLARELDELDPALKLPLVEIAVPALKRRPRQQLDYLFELLEKQRALDPEPRLFDYALTRLLAHSLLEHAPAATRGASAARAVESLLANVARLGHRDSAAADAAYAAGVAALGGDLRAAPLERAGRRGPDAGSTAERFAELDAALGTLAALAPRVKRAVLAAVLATIRHDRVVEVHEAELFRTIAATLGCPLPPSATLHER